MIELTGGNEYTCMEEIMTTRWADRGCYGVEKGFPWIVQKGLGMCRDALSEGWGVQLCWGKGFISYIL